MLCDHSDISTDHSYQDVTVTNNNENKSIPHLSQYR